MHVAILRLCSIPFIERMLEGHYSGNCCGNLSIVRGTIIRESYLELDQRKTYVTFRELHRFSRSFGFVRDTIAFVTSCKFTPRGLPRANKSYVSQRMNEHPWCDETSSLYCGHQVFSFYKITSLLSSICTLYCSARDLIAMDVWISYIHTSMLITWSRAIAKGQWQIDASLLLSNRKINNKIESIQSSYKMA